MAEALRDNRDRSKRIGILLTWGRRGLSGCGVDVVREVLCTLEVNFCELGLRSLRLLGHRILYSSTCSWCR
jgi:hypothetical protein